MVEVRVWYWDVLDRAPKSFKVKYKSHTEVAEAVASARRGDSFIHWMDNGKWVMSVRASDIVKLEPVNE